jgi:hypothetical protein
MQQEPDNESPDEIEDTEPRDSVLLRWAKFVSIIVVLAVILGSLFGFSIHVVAWHTYLSSSNSTIPVGSEKHLLQQSANDTRHAFKQRFIIGSTIGGVLGLIYVIRCLVKDEDP